MKNKNNLLTIVSVILGVCAVAAAVIIVIKHLERKKSKLECTDYVFENDFDDDGAESENA